MNDAEGGIEIAGHGKSKNAITGGRKSIILLPMETPDYDDSKVEGEWCHEAHGEVSKYLAGEGIPHGTVGEWPAWHVVPVISVWAIESATEKGTVGWWVVYGDIPTDYIAAGDMAHPRDVLRAIAWRWKEYVDAIKAGNPPEGYSVGGDNPEPELLDMLESRAGLLVEMAADDEVWVGM